MNNNIILCQPDARKSCCACCGLFNFQDISRDSLSSFLARGHERKINLDPDYEWQERESIKVRDFTSHICPYTGFIIKSKPGCLLHGNINPRDMRDISLFGSHICNEYLCPAHKILEFEQKGILIKYIDDWYLYSIAIIDPESFIWILDSLRKGSGCAADVKAVAFKKGLKSGLEAHSEFLRALDVPVFHYSISEYDLNKHIFSLGSDSQETALHRERIRELLESGL